MGKQTLYQKDTAQRMKQWSIEVIDKGDHSIIEVRSGLVDGKLTPTQTIIDKGKNVGKANATTHYTQAVAEAESKIEVKRKAGYVTEPAKAKVQGVLGSGCPKPMLAHKYHPTGEQNGSKTLEKMGIKGEVGCCQRKFDGVRRISKVTVSDVQMFTRKGIKAQPLPHIASQLKERFVEHLSTLQNDYEIDDHIWVDCEAYTDMVSFNKLNGILRKEKLNEQDKKILDHVQFRIYDVIVPLGYEHRKEILPMFAHKDVIVVESFELEFNDEELKKYHDKFVKHGYEGLMIRQYGMPYDNKRSWQLVKMKVFEDKEMKIVGGEESVRRGELGAFIVTDGDHEFRCSLKFSQPERIKMWNDLDNYIGKHAKVEFFGRSEYGVPRFPKAVAIRKPGE